MGTFSRGKSDFDSRQIIAIYLDLCGKVYISRSLFISPTSYKLNQYHESGHSVCSGTPRRPISRRHFKEILMLSAPTSSRRPQFYKSVKSVRKTLSRSIVICTIPASAAFAQQASPNRSASSPSLSGQTAIARRSETPAQAFVESIATKMFQLSTHSRTEAGLMDQKQALLAEFSDMDFVVKKLRAAIPNASLVTPSDDQLLTRSLKRLVTRSVFSNMDAPHLQTVTETSDAFTVMMAKKTGQYDDMVAYAARPTEFKIRPDLEVDFGCNSAKTECNFHNVTIQIVPDETSPTDINAQFHFIVHEEKSANGSISYKLIDMSAGGVSALREMTEEVAGLSVQQIIQSYDTLVLH
jgi:hypothetical protein